jgi:hypothetical protein
MVHPYECVRRTLFPAVFFFFGDPADLEMRLSRKMILTSLLWFSAASNSRRRRHCCCCCCYYWWRRRRWRRVIIIIIIIDDLIRMFASWSRGRVAPSVIGYGLQDLVSGSGRKTMDAAVHRHVKFRSVAHAILFHRVMALIL